MKVNTDSGMKPNSFRPIPEPAFGFAGLISTGPTALETQWQAASQEGRIAWDEGLLSVGLLEWHEYLIYSASVVIKYPGVELPINGTQRVCLGRDHVQTPVVIHVHDYTLSSVQEINATADRGNQCEIGVCNAQENGPVSEIPGRPIAPSQRM
jgi:hypothetical protein